MLEKIRTGVLRNVNCGKHVRNPWKYVVCNACGALFDLSEPEGSPRSAKCKGGLCPACGAPLLHRADAKSFTARVVCDECARAVVARRPEAYFEADPSWEPRKK